MSYIGKIAVLHSDSQIDKICEQSTFKSLNDIEFFTKSYYRNKLPYTAKRDFIYDSDNNSCHIVDIDKGCDTVSAITNLYLEIMCKSSTCLTTLTMKSICHLIKSVEFSFEADESDKYVFNIIPGDLLYMWNIFYGSHGFLQQSDRTIFTIEIPWYIHLVTPSDSPKIKLRLNFQPNFNWESYHISLRHKGCIFQSLVRADIYNLFKNEVRFLFNQFATHVLSPSPMQNIESKETTTISSYKTKFSANMNQLIIIVKDDNDVDSNNHYYDCIKDINVYFSENNYLLLNYSGYDALINDKLDHKLVISQAEPIYTITWYRMDGRECISHGDVTVEVNLDEEKVKKLNINPKIFLFVGKKNILRCLGELRGLGYVCYE